MLETPQITRTAAQPTAVIHVTVPRAEIHTVMGPGLADLRSALAAQRVTPTGPWFTHHLRMAPDVFNFEIGLPVAVAVVAEGRMTPGELPATTAARAVYRGAFEGLAAAWAELDAWVAAAGHTPATDLWECYLVGPETGADPADWRTELTRPLTG